MAGLVFVALHMDISWDYTDKLLSPSRFQMDSLYIFLKFLVYYMGIFFILDLDTRLIYRAESI
jgi:hypothetical protein